MGQIPRSTERILVRIAVRYNKTDTDCCYRSLGGGQYFPNIGETISNSNLNTSHYLYNGDMLLLIGLLLIAKWMILSGYFMSKSVFGQHFLTQNVWVSKIIAWKVRNIDTYY